MDVPRKPWHRRWWRSRWVRWPVFALALLVMLYLFHRPLLRGLGSWLWCETPLAHADVACVLGGGARERGRAAGALYVQGVADRFICTGVQVPGDVEVLGLAFTESDMTGHQVVRNGVPVDRVTSLRQGTSTQEEADALLPVLKASGADTVIIVSHRFHLRRIRGVFTERYRKSGITVLLHGAPSDVFDEAAWWRSESGMIMVFNEYAKLLYYAVKH
jgi:uncharacterized SAM-binding protein YcdF (DUF218 family)